MYFFYSHGNLWATCRPTDRGAGAFGPLGCAREADIRDLGIDPREGETEAAAARRVGRLVFSLHPDGWWTVSP